MINFDKTFYRGNPEFVLRQAIFGNIIFDEYNHNVYHVSDTFVKKTWLIFVLNNKELS